ncbi:MAG: hypothetical protein WDW36_001197 [Sanguina aurantia]
MWTHSNFIAGCCRIDPCNCGAGNSSTTLQGFKTTDQALLRACANNKWTDGACAVGVWIVNDTVLVANVGDAKCVLARVSDKVRVPQVLGVKGSCGGITLTKDHLAIHASERTRIEKAGGVVSEGRLMGKTLISRSFGDTALKKSGCTATPDVQAFELTSRDQFLLCASDGFWGVFDPQGAVDIVAVELAKHQSSSSAACKAVTNRLLNMAVRERKCADNCTVLMVCFHRNA